MYGRGFRQTSRSLCGPFNVNHRLTCEKTVGVPVSMHVRQGWYIEEVTDYSRAVRFDAAPVSVDPLVSASQVSSSVATFGLTGFDKLGSAQSTVFFNNVTATKGSGPLFGAMFSIGLNAAVQFSPLGELEVFSRPTMSVDDLAAHIDAALVQLTADIEAQTRELVANGLSEENARQLSAALSERRRQLYTEFPILRQSRMDIADDAQRRAEISALADDLFAKAGELMVDINVALPETTTPTEDDVRRAHFALSIAKLAAVEEMVLMAEGILLEAYSLPEFSCEAIVESRPLAIRSQLLRARLQDAVDALVAYGSVRGREGLDRRVSEDVDEFEFDARRFSYPIAAEVAFIEEIVDDTLAKCHRLRDPLDPFRSHFETNTMVPTGP